MGKQYFCDELNDVLSCFHDRIMSCCSGHIGPVYYEAYRGQKIDWDKFKQRKQEAFDLLTEENIDKSPCKGCFFLRERKPTDVVSPTFKTLNVSHWTQCNCGCIYCARMFDSKGEITLKTGKSQYYDFVPLLKHIRAHLAQIHIYYFCLQHQFHQFVLILFLHNKMMLMYY